MTEYVWHAASGDPSTAVVIVPGLGMTPERYQDLAVAFNEAGLNAAVVRNRIDADNYGMRELADHVAQVAAELITQRDQTSFILIGHSMGGRIAAMTAAQRPRGLEALITLCTGTGDWHHYPELRDKIAIYSRVRIGALLARTLGHYPGDKLGFGGRQPKNLMLEFNQLSKTNRIHETRNGKLTPALLGGIAVPTLAISYSDDALAPRPSTYAFEHELIGRLTTIHHEHRDSSPTAAAHMRPATDPHSVITAVLPWRQHYQDNPITAESDPITRASIDTGLIPTGCVYRGSSNGALTRAGEEDIARLMHELNAKIDDGFFESPESKDRT